MTATILFALVGLAGAPEAVPAARPADPSVKIWLDPSRGFERGDRVRLDARAELDGYLLILHADPSGRIRVLFPIDPFDDNYVRGRKKQEIRGRGDRHAFTIYESRGVGTVLAAWSPDPFRMDEFVRGDHWDYTVASTWDAGGDAETYLVGLAQRMATSAQFDYDVVQYDVGAPIAYRGARHYRLSWYDHSYYDRYGFTVGWGSPYWSSWSYPYGWYGYGYYPAYYDPWYDSWGWYSPYRAYCLGWCSWRSYYYDSYWRSPRTYVYNTYYVGGPTRAVGSSGYTFKLNGQPGYVVEPRQRSPIATEVGRRLVAEPAGVATGNRTQIDAPGRRAFVGRTVVSDATNRRTLEQPRRVGLDDRALLPAGDRQSAEPRRVDPRDRAVVPTDQGKPEPRRVDPRDRAVVPADQGKPEPRRVTPERASEPATRPQSEPRQVERPPVARPPAERPSVEARPRLEPRREPPRAAPERASPSRGSTPSARSAPPRSSAPRSSPPARSSGGSRRPPP